jgi:2-oxo-3-hexenedioate decarboxylase/2-keto-4-pentenoate hydratase
VLGHPYDALAWLAEHLASRGGRLEPGQWVTTGSIVPTRYPKPGQIYEFAVADLPPVRLEVG